MQGKTTHFTPDSNPILACLCDCHPGICRVMALWDVASRALGKVRRESLAVLVLAVMFNRALVLRQLAVVCLWSIRLPSCYKRLRRLLEKPLANQAFRRAWVHAVLRTFAPGRGPLVLLWDWTTHRDQLKSLWVGLAGGGRAVPLLFWPAPIKMGGPGSQRKREDQALDELLSMLPKGRRVVLVADRAFTSMDRIRLWADRGLFFVLRLRQLTMIEVDGKWRTLPSLQPPEGQQRR